MQYQTPTKSSPKNDQLAFTPDPTWDVGNVEISTIDVSQWEGSNKYVKVLSNVLTKKECVDFIQLSEAAGYEQAKVNMGYKEVLMLDVRNNDRCIVDSPITMEFIWQRLVTICGNDADLFQAAFTGDSNLHAVGLNERMRLLRYDPGTYFAPHMTAAISADTTPVNDLVSSLTSHFSSTSMKVSKGVPRDS